MVLSSAYMCLRHPSSPPLLVASLSSTLTTGSSQVSCMCIGTLPSMRIGTLPPQNAIDDGE
eukprot:3478101-Heterocapsa_arctica.AAC.1